jgi:hypothetical protein
MADERNGWIVAEETEQPGATASFPYDRMTVERFRQEFPRARWRDDLRAWFVPGTRAVRRLSKWVDREMSGILAHADARGRDAAAFDPIESAYLHADEELRVVTPYSRTVVEEMRAVPWASWDRDLKAWRIPYRSYEDLRRRWPAIEEAARRNEPEERRKRALARVETPEHAEALGRAAEFRRHRFPVALETLPPLDRPLMTARGAVAFTEVTGEYAEPDLVRRFYGLPEDGADRVWAMWRRPLLEELVGVWPARDKPGAFETTRGWWQPTHEELREARRRARIMARAHQGRAGREQPGSPTGR